MLLSALFLLPAWTDDSLLVDARTMDEVVVVSSRQGSKRSLKGQTASIDEHLQQLSHVSLVRRGSYAWEPMVNNMQTERLSTTIDGMKIFYACTDKMDPVTSYVESGNLQSISLNSGLDGNPQATGNIGGSLDLRLRKVGFDNHAFRQNLSMAYETNGHVQVYGTDVALSSHRSYSNFGAFYRHADDYKAGGGQTVRYSQFQKINAFINAGHRLSDWDVAEMTLIFDRATDVGYPALTMDVSKAQAVITSLSYKHLFSWSSWETKMYYNHIVHEMDDTHRPDVQIHMDMPGRSSTMGLYSQLAINGTRHHAVFNYDTYSNRLFADMTMYPGGAAPMYMVTWPDVLTWCSGASVSDDIDITPSHHLRFSGKVTWQRQQILDDEGLHALSVFFPMMHDRYYQITGRASVNYQLDLGHTRFSVGGGWGSRAPSVTEAYGYYLNNTADLYDYMGNPSLKNESAIESKLSVLWHPSSNWTVGFDANAFFFQNYIIGHVEYRLSPMTIGARGVKVYGNMAHAMIANATLSTTWDVPLIGESRMSGRGSLTYSVGHDADNRPLPLIAPLNVNCDVAFSLKRFQLHLSLQSNARQSKYGQYYGEQPAEPWTICHLAAQYDCRHTTWRVGMENVFDTHYSTYADWNHIPQKGRNVYASLNIEL